MLSSLIPCNNNEPLLNGIVMCDKKWILYDNWRWPAQWLDRETAPQHFPKPDLHQKRCHGYCLLLCCPSDPLKLSESQWNHYIWEIHSASQDAPSTATPAGGTGQQKGSNSSQQQHLTARNTIKASKVEQIGSYILPHPPDSPDLLPYLLLLQESQSFAGKMLP